ncbi:P-loop containing nucleoside triphosphate hydrolase protein [Pholiota conissans]|uniref:RNA helicase n=1 Tax=Pholiota conissans TaxID=109636 RepID=A0A9P5Z5B3_9AGAR|nr:P-loop containing nucleoside triphosphate hydrolase protein [Pholiota conissans]
MLSIRQGCRRSLAKDLFATSFTNQRSRHEKAQPNHRKQRDTSHNPDKNPFDFSGLQKKRDHGQNEPSQPRGNFFRQGPNQQYKRQAEGSKPPHSYRHPALQHQGPYRSPAHPHHVAKPPVIEPERIVPFFEGKVSEWAARPHTLSRLLAFGLPQADSLKLLRLFVEEVEAGNLSDLESQRFYHLERFAQPHDGVSIDVIFSTTFFWWAAKESARLQASHNIPSGMLHTIKQLVKVTSRTFPADEFHLARSIHRKIIMHVGPTNSGKTHHALRALAAAKSGVYAGPLRLLAHEIFLRLNKGQIAPLGVEEEAPKDPKGDPNYSRQCNMITGEEKKIVDLSAGHISCTVEMLTFSTRYDVAVIDEIQMIADPDRGSGWLSAVVGTWASEVHLCGEETVIPLVQALLEHTGDEIEIRRYQRLTPLVVEPESLKGDFSKVRKGDCIVAFNRSSIFAIKKTVEEVTGMRCAVVYGRLPPEVRSEQAALFNDPDSKYDVIIGSDAIGMGLNLKIKRVIFAATAKFDGQSVRPLAVTSVKQIAGRAGRYGLHKEQTDLGGTTTTLFDEDLPHLKHCVATPYKALPYVHIGFHIQLFSDLLAILPLGTPVHTVLSAAKYIARLPPFVRYANDEHLITACNFIDREWRDMSNTEKVSLLNAPIPWRDERTVEILSKLLKTQAQGDIIDFNALLQGTGLLETMEDLDRRIHMEAAGISTRSVQITNALVQMETLHKIMVFYMWMSFRHPLLYSDSETVVSMKEKLEGILNWTLDNLSKKLVKEQGLQGLMPLVNKRALENRPSNDPLLLASQEA